VNTVSRINVKFDRRTFTIVSGTLSFMLDNFYNPNILDPAAFLINKEDIADFVKKLKQSDTGHDEITVSMNFDDWVVYGTLLSHTSSKIPQSDPEAYDILDALHDECGRLDDEGKAPDGPKCVQSVRTWQTLPETEKNLIGRRIDAEDPFNKYGENAGEICAVDLPFYREARLLRVASRSPAVGSRYFILRGNEILALHRLPEVKSFCDERLGIAHDSNTAIDYFRFAHYFSEEGHRTSLVELPQDLRIDTSSTDPEDKKAISFIQAPEIRSDNDGLTVAVCTFDENESRLYRDRYRLAPGEPLQLLSRNDSGINLRHPFHDRHLNIGRSVSS